jgi:diphthamide biosynthesis enzyme Dph1/Dph2-like protein
MEAVMIANPHYSFYQYNPYMKVMTEERYDNGLMIRRRIEEIYKCGVGKIRKICFILGTLGRQGNPGILNRLI